MTLFYSLLMLISLTGSPPPVKITNELIIYASWNCWFSSTNYQLSIDVLNMSPQQGSQARFSFWNNLEGYLSILWPFSLALNWQCYFRFCI